MLTIFVVIRMESNEKNNRSTTNEESNILQHSENEFSEICEHGLKHGGIHIVASKSHGKTRLLFSMARKLREKSRVLIFDGSETWLYAFDKIETFTVHENDIVLVKDVKTTEDIERYAINDWHLIELALKTHKDILFRLKTRKPSKRGFFVRQVINYLDLLQRESRQTTQDNEANGYIAYFIEEAQDCFNSRSTTRLEAEEFLTVFNEARNQKEAFYTASQRETDFSRTIRSKQTYCCGKIPEQDKSTNIRRLEKQYNIDFAKLEARTWFFEGKTFKSPEWKQNGKPFQINKTIKKAYIDSLPQKPKGIWAKMITFWNTIAQMPKEFREPQEINHVIKTAEEEEQEFNEEEQEFDEETEEFLDDEEFW